MDYSQLIARRQARFLEVEEALGDPELFSNPSRAKDILREHRNLKQSIDLWNRLQEGRKNRRKPV